MVGSQKPWKCDSCRKRSAGQFGKEIGRVSRACKSLASTWGTQGSRQRQAERWASRANLLNCLILVKSFDRTAYSCRKLNMKLFPREMFQLVFFNFLGFGSCRLKGLNAVVEAVAYRCDLQPIHSFSSVLSLNVQITFEVWTMGTEQDLLI